MLDALDLAIWTRRGQGQRLTGLVHHSDLRSTSPCATPRSSQATAQPCPRRCLAVAMVPARVQPGRGCRRRHSGDGVCSGDRDPRPRCRLDVSAGLVLLYDLLGSARALTALDKVITLDHR